MFYQFIEAVWVWVLEAKMNGCWKNLLVTHRRFILNVENLEAITNIVWSHLAFCHVNLIKM